LGIESIGKEGIEYNSSEIRGDSVYDSVFTKTMDHISADGYMRRVFSRYQYVALPPYSKVAIGYYWYNNTFDTLDIESIRIPLSRQIEEEGDVTKILYNSNFQEGETCTNNLCRYGKYIESDGIGLVNSDMYKDAKSGVVIERLTIIPPIEITKYEIEYINEYISKIILYVRNNTDEYLENIWINYSGSESAKFNLNAYQEISFAIYKQCRLDNDWINCGPVKIVDRNTKTHCFMYGSPWDGDIDPDSITVFNKMGDQWVSGAFVQPTVESFCIQRIPYKYTTEDMIGYFKQEEPIQTPEQYWKELLDIDVLPITSYHFGILNKYLSLLKPLGIDTL
jgi:hypothetical protein